MPKLKFEGIDRGDDYPGSPIEGGDYSRFRWTGLSVTEGPKLEPSGGWNLVDDVLGIGSGTGAAFHGTGSMVKIVSGDGTDFTLTSAAFASYENSYFVVIGLRDGERVANKRVSFGPDPQVVRFGEEFAAVDRLKFKRWDADGPTTEIICEAFAMDDLRLSWVADAALA